MKFLWISGWAVPPNWLAEQAQMAFPHSTHAAVSPSEADDALHREKFDSLGGYSLGALWLLMQADVILPTTPVILLAPIFSFAAENGDGGRVTLAQLRLQRRRFRNDANAALADFYRRSGLENMVPAMNNLTPVQRTALDTELGWLEDWRCTKSPPAHWQGYVGGNDALLDATLLQQKWSALRRVPGAGHAPRPLLQAAARELSTSNLR